jgi:cytosine/adenosine deaminase-related metal-dependent hydrolase
MTDILIRNTVVITMDPARRVIENGAIAISGDRIEAVGPDHEVAEGRPADRIIDGSRRVALPGLIDSHAHAGHALVKSLGAGRVGAWFEACDVIYRTGSTPEFWRAEARLAALERLKAGVTTGVSLLGGGADVMRTDDSLYGGLHCQAVGEIGIRSILAVGPGRPPFPKEYLDYRDGAPRAVKVDFERQMIVSEEVVRRWHGSFDGRVQVCATLPVFCEDDLGEGLSPADVKSMSRAVLDLRERNGLLLTQDGHRSGSLAYAERELGLLGPWSFMSHCVDLTPDDIAAVVESGATIVHNPSAIMSIKGRCPVPELLDAGVTVMLGSDGAAPDRGYDMFRHMAQCMHYHRRHFRDPSYLPPGKVLEMTTIDAAKALGMDREIGSIEVGKRADVVLLDVFKPHLYPFNMPVTRIAHYANAADVDSVIVDGRMLMQARKVLSVDEATILEEAQAETDSMLDRTGLRDLTSIPGSYWGQSRLST